MDHMYAEIRSHCENFAKAVREESNRHLLSTVCERIHGLLNEYTDDGIRQDWQSGDCRTGSLPDGSRHQKHEENNIPLPIFEDFIQKIDTVIQIGFERVRHLERAVCHRKLITANKDYQQKLSKMQNFTQMEMQKMERKIEELKKEKDAEKSELLHEIRALSSKNDVLQNKISRFRLMADQLNSEDVDNSRNVYIKRDRK